jgi:hypothetical protein
VERHLAVRQIAERLAAFADVGDHLDLPARAQSGLQPRRADASNSIDELLGESDEVVIGQDRAGYDDDQPLEPDAAQLREIFD